ncbi:hypothetical protein [Adhaeribacter pallidiroseus]|uniref:Glycosyltransferase RgtA/B/C/D-like domain-containing protein n=1 Tax=Adhaeribacter pallidiroseus TaxID=2072847 RepID=A0A369QNQ4_9BACT|nr:hypothetical protein [Adhaeribacter pallidiroseus]RDC63848.1 hypothetical protein AHMF7616_02457 [Adhaeribacter pallidiroseus]
MPKNHPLSLVGYIAAGVLIFTIQTHLIGQAGFFDYDSARNWQIVQEIGNGHFEHLFQHASPTFFLFYACFTFFALNFQFYILVNCLFNVLAILLIGRFVALQVNLTAFFTFLLLIFTGLSGYLAINGRYFTIEAPSLFLFAFLLPQYYKRFREHSYSAFLQVAGLLAIGLTINYKFLLLLPIALVLEYIYFDRALQKKHLIYSGLILLLPFVFYAGIAALVNLPFYRFPAVYYTLIHNYQVPNPSARVGFLNVDLSFYLQYFLRFESPLVVAGLFLFPLLFRRQIFIPWRKTTIHVWGYLFWIILLYVAGMHLLQKAPRGLFLVYSLLYAITFVSSLHLIRNRILLVGLISTSIIYQGFVLQKEVFAYANTSYPLVVNYLQHRHITKLASAVGLGITPFAQKANLEVTLVFNEAQLPALKAQGYRYVLLDDYYLAANILNFKKIEKITPVATWSESSLMVPYLYLDQSEFTGFSYEQALQARQHAVQDSIQLRLILIP